MATSYITDSFAQSLGTTTAEINSIPGLADQINSFFTAFTNSVQGGYSLPGYETPAAFVNTVVKPAIANPVQYVQDQYLQQAQNYAEQAYLNQLTPSYESSATNFFGQAIQFLEANGVSADQISSLSNQALSSGEQAAQSYVNSQNSGNILNTVFEGIADIVAVMTGNPELIPLINGAGAVISGDTLAQALEVAAVSYVTQQSAAPITQYFQNTLGLDANTAKALTNAVTNTLSTAVTDPSQITNALTTGLLTSMVTSTTNQIPNFSSLSPASQQAINTSITDFIKSEAGSGISTQQLLNQALSLGQTAGLNALNQQTATNAGYPDYATYQAAQQGGFSSYQNYQQASSLGFTTQSAFNTATSEGFTNATDYNNAQKLGLSNSEQYSQYQNLVNSGQSSSSALQAVQAIENPNSTYGQLLNLFMQEQGQGNSYGAAGPQIASSAGYIAGSAPAASILGANASPEDLQTLKTILSDSAGFADSGITKNADGSFNVNDPSAGLTYTIDANGNLLREAVLVSGTADAGSTATSSQEVEAIRALISSNIPSGSGGGASTTGTGETTTGGTTGGSGSTSGTTGGSSELGFVGVNFADLSQQDLQNVVNTLVNATGTTGSASSSGLTNVGVSMIGTADNGTPIYQLSNGFTFVLATVNGQVQPTQFDPNQYTWTELQNPVSVNTPPSTATGTTTTTTPGTSTSGNATTTISTTTPSGPVGGGGGGGGGSQTGGSNAGGTGSESGGGSTGSSGTEQNPIPNANVVISSVGGNVINGSSTISGAGTGPTTVIGGISGGGSSTGSGTSSTTSGTSGAGSSTGGSGTGTGGGYGTGTGVGTGSGTNYGYSGGSGGGSGGGTGTGTGTGEGEGDGSGSGETSVSGGGPLFIPTQYGKLAQLLNITPQMNTGTTQGLTGGGEGSEIESGTGKERQNVWNESSLRLRDALGLG